MMSRPRRIAFQGEPGANSHIACHDVYPDHEAMACPTFEDAFQAVSTGTASLGMIPIENSIAGRVADIHHLLPDSGLHIIGEYFLPVHYCLVAPKGATLKTIRKVRSHPQALGQCRKRLREHGFEPEIGADTAGSAHQVANMNDPAYAALVAHVALGYLQDVDNPAFAILFGGGALAVAGLHAAAALEGRREARSAGTWVAVCAPGEIADKRARIVRLPDGDRAAVFRNGARVSAISNACAHQNGPLGEGRIVFGCVTCPWHGYQYRMEDGCSPPPFTEKVPTYNLRLRDGVIEIDARANAPGTPVPPLDVAGMI